MRFIVTSRGRVIVGYRSMVVWSDDGARTFQRRDAFSLLGFAGTSTPNAGTVAFSVANDGTARALESSDSTVVAAS